MYSKQPGSVMHQDEIGHMENVQTLEWLGVIIEKEMLVKEYQDLACVDEWKHLNLYLGRAGLHGKTVTASLI